MSPLKPEKSIFGNHESEARKRRWRLLWRRIISSLDLYGLKNYLLWTPVVWGNISLRSELTSNCLAHHFYSDGVLNEGYMRAGSNILT